jgi:hypothetical protein
MSEVKHPLVAFVSSGDPRLYATPAMVAQRRAALSVCADLQCTLSGGYAHAWAMRALLMRQGVRDRGMPDRGGAVMPLKKRSRSRPGSRWRLLTHPRKGPPFEARSQGVFDELVVDNWLHIEQMNVRDYWMKLGPIMINVRLRTDGKMDIGIERDAGPGGKIHCAAIDTDGKDHPGDEGETWWGRDRSDNVAP